MKERDQSRLASALTALVGIFVAISPAWLTLSTGLRTSTIVTGIIIAIAGLVQYFWENTVPSWISALAAVWLFISVFAYSGSSAGAQWTLAISAIVTFILAFWDGVEVSLSMQHHHQT